MFAIVEISAQQFRVQPSEVIDVPKLPGNVGDEVTFSNILVAGDATSIKVGTPSIGGNVTAKILEHGKGEKIIVFKKKRRKGYRKKNGHRQHFTTIEITNIALS